MHSNQLLRCHREAADGRFQRGNEAGLWRYECDAALQRSRAASEFWARPPLERGIEREKEVAVLDYLICFSFVYDFFFSFFNSLFCLHTNLSNRRGLFTFFFFFFTRRFGWVDRARRDTRGRDREGKCRPFWKASFHIKNVLYTMSTRNTLFQLFHSKKENNLEWGTSRRLDKRCRERVGGLMRGGRG